jgi:hypothetical protein
MTLNDLTKLAMMKKIAEHPLIPLHALPPVRPFKDASSNELTRAIVEFVRLTGHYADRINNTGIYDKRTGKWRKGGTRKGISDIIANKMIEHQGRRFSIMVAIEVKVGKDKMSEHQIKVQSEVQNSGGVYIIAKTWEQFYQDWQSIK